MSVKVIKLETYCPIHELFEFFHEEDQAAFLDSSLQDKQGRYSIIGRKPYLTLVQKEKLYVNGNAVEQSFESYLKDYLRNHTEENPTHLPIISGAIGYFTYDYGRRREGVASRFEEREEDLIPEAVWNFYDEYIIEDHELGELYLCVGGRTQSAEEALQEIETILKASKEAVYALKNEASMNSGVIIREDSTKEEYLSAIQKMKDYIVEGDIYIANLTRQLAIESEKSPYETFKKLRVINPSPFGGYFQYGDFQVVSASPERFLKMKDNLVETRPIKGTRKRGATREEDEALKKELEESGKDRSELLMIVDLERNDLSRVCREHTVRVPQLFDVETYATVFHLVSTITGELREDQDICDLVAAAFPGGSITGAPKIRAMEIIDELERGKRGLYTGSMGYIALNGDCDLNIVIRTLVHKDGTYHLGVGGGITCESENEFEFEETWQKAIALVDALQ